MINLKKAIAYASGKDVRIAGGLGLTIDEPIVITENHHGFAVELERFVAKEVAVFYGMWNADIGTATLRQLGDKHIDELQINHLDNSDEPTESRLYFDISAGYTNVGLPLKEVKSSDEVERIYSNKYHKVIEPIPHFYAAVYWALHQVDDEELDLRSAKQALALESDEEAKLVLSKLAECGFEVKL